MAVAPQEGQEQRRGHAIDPAGASVIDPTKNVLDLVTAAIARQDDLRTATERLNEVRIAALNDFQTARVNAESLIQNWMRDTEMKRLAEKDNLRQFYETRIADMLRTSVESTSTLVSNQLVQIQSTFNDRVSQLERFRYETGGKTSIADPALADALMRHTTDINRLNAGITDAMGKMAGAITELRSSGTMTVGRTLGQRDLVGWIVAGILFLSSVAGVGIAFVNSHSAPTLAVAPALASAVPPGFALMPIPPSSTK